MSEMIRAKKEKMSDLIKRKDDRKSDRSDLTLAQRLDIRHSVFGELDRTTQYRNNLFSFRRIVRNLKQHCEKLPVSSSHFQPQCPIYLLSAMRRGDINKINELSYQKKFLPLLARFQQTYSCQNSPNRIRLV